MDLYGTLGIQKNASNDEIKKAYRRLAMEKHPDRGGNTEEFQKIQTAHETLTNPDSRAHYDTTGQIPGAAEGSGGGGGGMPPDLASMFGSIFGGGGGFNPFGFGAAFGNGGGGQPSRRMPRGPNKVHDIGVTLRDLWQGKRFTLNMNRDTKCTACNGKGGSRVDKCTTCGGKGMIQIIQQMGPMMSMRSEQCRSCNGCGETVADKCGNCNGAKVLGRESTLEVVVEPGMQEGDRIVFAGACSESADFDQPGDVILVVRQAADPESTNTNATSTNATNIANTWLRKGSELMTEVRLSWAEAMMGWGVQMDNHPSGKPLRVVWHDGPIRDGEVLRVGGWGMPIRGSPGAVGDLRIVCRIEPQAVGWSAEQFAALKRVWPDWREPVATTSATTVKAERVV